MKPRTTPKPVRLTISVDPETHAVFQRLADLTGLSLGGLMGSWLHDTRDAASSLAQQVGELRGGVRRATAELVASQASTPHSVAVDVVSKAKRSARTALASDASAWPGAGEVEPGPPRPVIRGGKSQAGRQGGRA